MPVPAAAGPAPSLLLPVSEAYAEQHKDQGASYGTAVSTQVPFKVRSDGGPVFVVVSKNKNLLKDVNASSVKKSTYIREMKSEGGKVFTHTVPVYNAFQPFWTNTPAKYWWTAVRVDCTVTKRTDDCAIEGPIREFEVFGQIPS